MKSNDEPTIATLPEHHIPLDIREHWFLVGRLREIMGWEKFCKERDIEMRDVKEMIEVYGSHIRLWEQMERGEAVLRRLERTADGHYLAPGDEVWVVANDRMSDVENEHKAILCVYRNGDEDQPNWPYTAKAGQETQWEEFDVESVWHDQDKALARTQTINSQIRRTGEQ